MISQSGVLDAVAETSALNYVAVGQSLELVLTSAEFTGEVVLERSLPGQEAFEVVASFINRAASTLSVSQIYRNETDDVRAYRLRAVSIDVDDTEEVAYSITEAASSFIKQYFAPDGSVLATLKFDLSLELANELVYPGNPNSEAAVTTNGVAPTEAPISAYNVLVTTGGSAGAEDLEIPAGTKIGQRLHLELVALGDVGDSVAIDVTNLADPFGQTVSAAVLDAVGEELLLEWAGAAWNVYGATAGVVTLV